MDMISKLSDMKNDKKQTNYKPWQKSKKGRKNKTEEGAEGRRSDHVNWFVEEFTNERLRAVNFVLVVFLPKIITLQNYVIVTT